MPPKVIQKTSPDFPIFATLPEPKANPTTTLLVKDQEMQKYGTMYTMFSGKTKKNLDAQEKYEIKLKEGNKVNISWVAKYRQQLKTYLVATYPTQSTLSTWFLWLANMLLIINKHTYRDDARVLFEDGRMTKDVSKEENKSMLNEKDRLNWIDFRDLETIREHMKIKRYANRKNKQLNIDYLILCLNTMLPPTRLDYCTAHFYGPVMQTTQQPYGMVKGYMDRVESPVGKKGLQKRYYLYHHKKGEWAVYMYYENKTGNKRDAKGLDKFTIFLDKDIKYDKLDDETGMPTGERVPITYAHELNNVITDSLIDYPRENVLPNEHGHDMNKDSYNASWFRSTRKHLHQNLIRDIYIYNFHRVRMVGTRTLKEIALYMRHDVGTALESYVKINVPPYKGRTIEIPVAPKKANIIEVERKPYFDPKAYGKKYRKGMINIGGDEAIDTEVKKKRDDIRKANYQKNKEKVLCKKQLFYLNKGLVLKPKETTIEKYGLKKEGDVWISTKF